MIRRFAILSCAVLLCGLLRVPPAHADSPVLAMPVDCVVGETCWVVNRVDIDPGPGARDHNCRDHTYDAHKGVDIAVAGGAAMRRGVDVLAAAPGVVLGTRDGMTDVDATETGRQSVAGRECGNRVVVRHGGDWLTHYCHLRQGSVRVAKGDRVETGDVVGQVGMSGLAQFPHLHLGISYGNVSFDPNTGLEIGKHACGVARSPMWRPDAAAALSDDSGAIYLAGIVGDVPSDAEARGGALAHKSPRTSSPALLVWFNMFRPDADDRVHIRIIGPGGKVMHDAKIVMEKDQARAFRYTGIRRTTAAWPSGTYRAEIELTRATDGKVQTVEVAADIP